jgi:DNA-binding MarR family transcriptional regulator
MTTMPGSPTDHRWADMADMVLTIARELQTQGLHDARIIRLATSESNVMRFIDRNPDSTASEVADGTGLQRSNLSTILRTLEGKGLVEKRENRQDGRGVRLHPTDLAGENLRLLRQSWHTLVTSAAGADPELLGDTVTLLGRIERGLIRNRQRASNTTVKK